VIGEHGDSEVLAWSRVTVGGLALDDYCRLRRITLTDADREDIDQRVRKAAYHIIQGKGATYYGIGSALARIGDVILHDQRSILTVCARMPEVAGVKDVTLALPHVVGGTGVIATLPLELSGEEQEALARSAGILRGAVDSLGH
jgi:L-lactate dehydrogenase